ncbi:MAG: hypothetical protein EBZ53_04475 [Verrucomicrobia bacterium]|nr:hypothetical protein [Verrucomicrobiota bacterium]
MKKLTAILSALVLAWQIGLPQGLLQTVAWGWMITSYSQEAGLKEGLRKTFDGHHPCGLCKRIAQSRPDSSPATLAPITPAPIDFLWILSSVRSELSPCRSCELLPASCLSQDLDRASPLLPPPRA